MKKLVVLLSVLALMLAAVGVVSTAASINVTFWSAPNPTQEIFWRNLAEKFNASQDEINVYVTAMVETPSSESTITNAIAGGKAPAASENVFPGFGATLVNSEALVALDTMPGWDELVQKRAMAEIVEGWKFADGHVYILPIYANAMLFGWRIDILRELGFDAPPTTYSGIGLPPKIVPPASRDRLSFVVVAPCESHDFVDAMRVVPALEGESSPRYGTAPASDIPTHCAVATGCSVVAIAPS